MHAPLRLDHAVIRIPCVRATPMSVRPVQASRATTRGAPGRGDAGSIPVVEARVLLGGSANL